MLDFRRTDTMCERTERTMSGGVAVTADDRKPRLCTPLLRSNDMDDTVIDMSHREELDPVLFHIRRERFQLCAGFNILHPGQTCRLIFSRCIMVRHRERKIRPTHGPPRLL